MCLLRSESLESHLMTPLAQPIHSQLPRPPSSSTSNCTHTTATPTSPAASVVSTSLTPSLKSPHLIISLKNYLGNP